MPVTEVTDVEGYSKRVFEFGGKYFPYWTFLDMDAIFSNLPKLPGREDDIMILTYPKSGTNWIWEVANMLQTGKAEVAEQNKTKVKGMIEFTPADSLTELPSVRLLNTHLTPEFYPTDLIKKKSKIVYLLRNPKDVMVSFFHFAKKLKVGHHGSWNGFFNLFMHDKCLYGSWFTYARLWAKFFQENPDVPVLTLYYESMKEDLYEEVTKLAAFLDVPCGEAFLKRVVEKCTFDSMKTARAEVPEELIHSVSGDTNPLFRKGTIGDWKTHFTVAQNERFDAEYRKQMAGMKFDFDKYM